LDFFKRKKEEDSSEKKQDLDAPSSLPDSLIEQYGLNKKNEEKIDHPQKIPEDLIKNKEEMEKMHDDSLKMEHIRNLAKELEVTENIPQQKEQSKNSFFEELEKKIKSGKHGVDNHFNASLVDLMKRYHKARVRGEHFFFHEEELDDALYNKMLKLKELENEWMIRAKEYNVAKELLNEKESEIEKASIELRSLIKSAEKFKIFSKQTTHDKAFRLNNGKILLSINDLLNELQDMSEEEYKHHVSSHKHDFSTWISHVFGQKELAELVKKCSNKDSLVETLSNY